MTAVFVVSRCCPVGCGTDVVVLRSADDRNLFCYCDPCGCVFRTPAAAQYEVGHNELLEPVHFAPNGVALPSKERLDQAGWADATLEVCEDDYEMIEAVNNRIAERLASSVEVPR